MAIELRERRETGPAFEGSEQAVLRVSANFQITGVSGVFRPEFEQDNTATDEWEQAEREADEDVRLGRYKDFDSREDLMDYLDKL